MADYKPRLKNFGYGLLVEDAAQAIFLLLYRESRSWQEVDYEVRRHCRELATAAVNAIIREPPPIESDESGG